MKHNVIHYFSTIIFYLLKNSPAIVVWSLVAAGGYVIFLSQRTPINLVLGLPMLLGGAGLAIQKVWSIVLSIASPEYNRGVCFICRGAKLETSSRPSASAKAKKYRLS